MKRLLAILGLVLAFTSQSFALSGDGGSVLLVQNGKVFLTASFVGQIPYTTSTTQIGLTAQGTSSPSQILHSNGAAAPTWGPVVLNTGEVSNVLPIASGGTNSGTALSAAGGVMWNNGSAIVAQGAGSSGQCLKSGGAGVPTWGACSAVNPVLMMASGQDVTTSQTVFMSPGSLDTVEVNAQIVSPAASYTNLQCYNPGIQGVGNNIVVTLMTGTCGVAGSGSTSTCTLTGAATNPTQSCTDTTHTVSPTLGQCMSIKFVTPATLTANARVTCTMERTA